jgi:hypothetical protein
MAVTEDMARHFRPSIVKIYIDFGVRLHERLGAMRWLKAFFTIGLCFVLSPVALAADPGPVDSLKGFSDFQQVDINRLLNGEVLSERGSLMDFPNGISSQTCFVVPTSAEETAKRLQLWDPSPHGELKVFAFHALHAPCELADFHQLDFKTNQRPVRWLLDKIVASTPSKSDLNLTRTEAQDLAGCVQKRANPQKVSDCMAKLLLGRASAFQQKGLDGAQPYEVGGESVSPAVQLRTMLREQLVIAHEFLPILKKIGLVENEAVPSLTPFYYWTLFDADYHGTISMGAVYKLPVGDHFQLVDMEYYVSGNYYTSATIFEVWPFEVGGKPAALVWRGDFFAAPMLAFTRGTERIAYGALMLQDIKKEIHCFQDEAKTK